MTVDVAPGERLVGRIPVRNLWLLMLYASDLTRFRERFEGFVDADIADLPDLVAQLLSKAVEHRLRRNLTRGYHRRKMVLHRVRGRIDVLLTEANLLLERGEVYCRFEELTIDTPRNRLIRAALDLMAGLVRGSDLVHRCRSLSSSLARAGVGGLRPSRAELALDQIGRNDSADRFMVSLAQLAFDLALPTQDSGRTCLTAPEREETWVRRLFEKAILGFARVELEPLEWRIRGGVPLHWQVSSSSDLLPKILPRMVTDIILDPPFGGRRIIVDTKFTSILGSRRFGGDGLKSSYIYQMYAYVRSQEGLEPQSLQTAGLLLHPAVDGVLCEHAIVQGHPITFATINLAESTTNIRRELRSILTDQKLVPK